MAVDSKKLEYGPGTIYAMLLDPSSLGFGVGGQSYSNLLAFLVRSTTEHLRTGLGLL